MLDLEHTIRDVLRTVLRKDGYSLLKYDGPGVVFFLHHVDRCPRPVNAVLDDGLVHSAAIHPDSAESRQKGGMDVDDAVPEHPDDLRWDLLQISRQNEEVDTVALEHPSERVCILVTGLIVPRMDDGGWNTLFCRMNEGTCRLAIRQTEDHAYIEFPPFDCGQNRLKIASTAGGEHGHIKRTVDHASVLTTGSRIASETRSEVTSRRA